MILTTQDKTSDDCSTHTKILNVKLPDFFPSRNCTNPVLRLLDIQSSVFGVGCRATFLSLPVCSHGLSVYP